ncbi:MAG: CsbD family protein [Alphaproteobacteria bacterium]|nr:CsbD family protein [Alphaproteobacteria bacterium]
MNNDIIEGNWKQLTGEVQKQWGKLTNDQLDQVNGNRTKLIGKVQESYGIARDEAEKQVKEWEKSRAA